MLYVAVFLDDTSRTNLLKFWQELIVKFNIDVSDFRMKTASGSQLVDHVTLQLGDFNPKLNDPSLIGKSINLTINSLGLSDKAIAFGVEHNQSQFGTPAVKTINAQPHITIAINPLAGGQPKHSNNITKWLPITPVQVSGKLAAEND